MARPMTESAKALHAEIIAAVQLEIELGRFPYRQMIAKAFQGRVAMTTALRWIDQYVAAKAGAPPAAPVPAVHREDPPPAPPATVAVDLNNTESLIAFAGHINAALLAARHKVVVLEAEKTAAEAKVSELEPEAAAWKLLADREGMFTLQNAGRVLGQRPNKWIDSLKGRYLFYQDDVLVPRVEYRHLFKLRVTIVNEKARGQTLVTPKGIQHFAKKLGVELAAGA